MSNKITLLIPTKNEAERISKCVLSANKLVDEIIVVDSFSTDDTKSIAESLGAIVIQRTFDNYSNQKNWAIPKASNEWILLLDADEYLTDKLFVEIENLIKSDNLQKYQAYWAFRQNHFFNKQLNYSGFQKDKVIRLFNKNKCKYINQVHEQLVVDGKIGFLKNKLHHNTYKGFDFHIQKLNHYATLQALDYNKKTTNLNFYHFILKPMYRFFKHYVIQQGFRDGVPGIIMSCLGSYAVFLRYVKIWMLRNNIDK
ncbi:glycosyltransferase family 2 protein [Myroides phaeus]|uniref:glycosyltransferase family 2 protein n=1 Tax=Myroides phaeus TaxID=702745 RepID=UPI001303F134|nr:glycosyltransferase family 2 protein [Myroides phaeus]